MGDIGINTTTSIIEHLKEEVEEKKIKERMFPDLTPQMLSNTRDIL